MKISAFVVTWNNPKDLAGMLQSARDQTRPPDELFVIDNTLVGACEAFNIGFKKAHNPLIAFFDDDVVLKEDWFEQMSKAVQKESDDVAVFSSNVVYSLPFKNPVQLYPRFLNSFEGCASVIRTSALEKVGYYDERFFIYGNERDLACRLLKHGFKIRLVPAAMVLHKRGPQVRLGKRSMYFHTRNELWNYIKHLPLKKMLVASLKFTLKTFLKAYKHGLTGAYFKALFATVAGLGYCVSKREVYDYLV